MMRLVCKIVKTLGPKFDHIINVLLQVIRTVELLIKAVLKTEKKNTVKYYYYYYQVTW